MTHFLVECPSKPLSSNNFLDSLNNGGAVCMPYYGFKSVKPFMKYNGMTRKNEYVAGSSNNYPLLDDQDYIWEDGLQCMTKDC